MRVFLLLTAVLISPLMTSIASAESSVLEISDRAQELNRMLYPKGIPQNYLDQAISPGISGVRQLRTVLPGVLYRSGGPGGQTPLPPSSLKSLCESGFSLAVYGYDTGFVPAPPINCINKNTGQPNSIEYIAGRILDMKFKEHYMKRVREVISDSSKGPVLVHCWNGYHASGELAAIALRQFCKLNGEKASAYWLRNAGGFPMISRVAKFVPFTSISDVPVEVEEVFCPKNL